MRAAAVSTRRTIPAMAGSADTNCVAISFWSGGLGAGGRLHHRELAGVFDRRDKLASDLVFKALPLLASPLIDEGAEFGAKDIAEAAARRGRQTVQQDARGPVRREYPALIVDGQQARAQRVQIFAAIMEGDQDIVRDDVRGTVHSRSGSPPWRRAPGYAPAGTCNPTKHPVFRSARHRAQISAPRRR